MKKKRSGWWVYLVQCADGAVYTGISTDVKRRVAEHNSGKGSKSVRGRRPVKLLYSEKSPNRSQAQKREAAIKRLSRPQKLTLIKLKKRLARKARV